VPEVLTKGHVTGSTPGTPTPRATWPPCLTGARISRGWSLAAGSGCTAWSASAAMAGPPWSIHVTNCPD